MAKYQVDYNRSQGRLGNRNRETIDASHYLDAGEFIDFYERRKDSAGDHPDVVLRIRASDVSSIRITTDAAAAQNAG